MKPMRMVVWLLIGLGLYQASRLVGTADPQLQVILQKAANVTTFAWFGYWIDRHALGRVMVTSTDLRRVARAIVIGACIWGGAGGL